VKILLFDMDGVLLEARGYHIALQETVARLASLLGFANVKLTAADIAAFEAAGITSEWDEAAICTALLLARAWQVDPGWRLPAEVDDPPAPALLVRGPDFQAFVAEMERAARIGSQAGSGAPPLARAAQLLCEDGSLPPEQAERLRSFLAAARTIEASLPMRIFQELALGSRVFQETYGLPARLQVESYLVRYDRANLAPAEAAALRGWLAAEPDRRAAIFTARPSLAPGGLVFPGEAEIGARLVGLGGTPIIGLGGTTWLEGQTGQAAETCLKPAPVHALAALRLALAFSSTSTGQAGDAQAGQAEALAGAAAFAQQPQPGEAWERLDGAEVCVFEDTRGGMLSALGAQRLLAGAGLRLHLRLFGIGKQPLKVKSLQAVGATVYPDLASALRQAGVLF
jgi:hypothetical protein